jgi:PKD repeat protein
MLIQCKAQSELPTPTLAIEPADCQALRIGETFSVNVTISDVTQDLRLVGVQFRVQYNATMLSVQDVQEGSFLQQFNNSAETPYTFFINYTEDNRRYGPDVLIGILLLPNATGEWTNFPYGNGTLTTITFRAINESPWPEDPFSCDLNLTNTMLIDDSLNEISHEIVSGHYQIQPLEFTYEPPHPSYGQVIFFESPTPIDYNATYFWDFGDETTQNTSNTMITHIYNQPGNYDATLSLYIHELGLYVNTTKTITVGFARPLPLDVATIVGSLHFRGEVAEFSILTKDAGEPINATTITVKLYHNGTMYADMSDDIQYVDTGLYLVKYNIPADADTGTYTLLAKASYYGIDGSNIASFIISPALTGEITALKDGIATVVTGITDIRLNLTAINATISGLIKDSQGAILAQINTAVGTITARLDTINATITQVDGNTATLQTTLGQVKTQLDDIQSFATTTLYATTVLSAIAVILTAAILLLMRKKARAQ